MTNLNIIERQTDAITILDLEGKIKIGEESAKLHETLRSLVKSGKNKVLLNMADVSYIDSSGLGELIGGYATLRKNGGELKLFQLSDRVHELMTLTKLLTVFEIYENEFEAIQSFTDTSAKPADADI
jgi:anti-sigma B factor antagonist